MKKSEVQVQGTNDFNTVSKCSMIKAGYFKDEFVSHFVTKFNRRTPLIHLGYYMRMLTVDYTLRSFLDLSAHQPIQVISCGAGFDTSFFRLTASGVLHSEVYFYEVDFVDVVERKTECILNSKQLFDCVGSYKVNPNGIRGLSGGQYCLIAADLQDLNTLVSNLTVAGVKFSLPTLLLAECAICYMDEPSASSLIEWAASTFEDATFVTYEQVYPDDGFGIVMQKHFANMNSPLLSLNKFPDLESQENRYLSRGWDSCSVWTAFEMFLHITTPEERRKILALEPFDELEEWHLEGCHFALMVASKGTLRDWFHKFANKPLLRTSSATIGNKPQVQWEFLDTEGEQNIRRFSHRTVKVIQKAGVDILVIGGFGHSANSPHGRCQEVFSVHKRFPEETNSVSNMFRIKEVQVDGSVKLDALHHTCTCLTFCEPDSAVKVMLYGGRHSPCKPVNVCPVIVSVVTSNDELMLNVTTDTMEKNVPQPRWRHSAVCLSTACEHCVVIFGGRTSKFKVLGDLHIWSIEGTTMNSRKVVQQKSSVNWPSSRFSHSAAVWNRSMMIVTCGLGEDVMPRRDIWCFSLESEMWCELPVIGILPRYSHTSAVHRDKLILLGGVNTLPGNQPGICVVDLNECSCTEYVFPAQDPAFPIMLHNHSSETLEEENALLIVGGGGNCFSFGTMFNHHLLKINLDQFR